MKKTIEELKQIIKEELQRILAEQEPAAPIDYSVLAAGQEDKILSGNLSRPATGQDDMLEEDEELYYENLE